LDHDCIAYWFQVYSLGDSKGICWTTNKPLHKSMVKVLHEQVYMKLRKLEWDKIEMDNISIKKRHRYYLGITNIGSCLNLCELDYGCTVAALTNSSECYLSFEPYMTTLKVGMGLTTFVLGNVSKVVVLGVDRYY